MANTSGEINSQSKQDINVCHIAKVKSATSAHYLAHVISFLAYVMFPLHFESNASVKPEKCISHALKTK